MIDSAMNEKRIMEGITKQKERIIVLGMGHVGLPTALGLAELGWSVTGADNEEAKVAALNAGQLPFYEPGLQKLFDKHWKSGRIRFTQDLDAAVRQGQILFICVGTPQHENGKADLSQVESVAKVIARNLNGYKLIIEKSTVPVITGKWVHRTIQRYAKRIYSSNGLNGSAQAEESGRENQPAVPQFEVASNPEFLQEGSAIQNFFKPDRIVCGVESDRAKNILAEIYRPLGRPVVFTDVATAELIKHAANAFLATKISFANMVADLCEAVGADVTMVAEGIGLDPRIGSSFLRAGIGYGGYCLPKDVRAFIHLAEENGVDFPILKSVEHVNQKRIEQFIEKIQKSLWILRGKSMAIFGLAFKPQTDDIREAPSLKIIQRLLEEGAQLRLHDPKAMSNTRQVLPEENGRVAYCSTPYEAAQGAHAVLLLTEWDEYRELDLNRLRDVMEIPLLIDGRNLFDPAAVRKAGFEYFSMGR